MYFNPHMILVYRVVYLIISIYVDIKVYELKRCRWYMRVNRV